MSDNPNPAENAHRDVWWRKDTNISDKLSVYETFRKYIQHEDSLINNRLNWMLTIHGFLYASYALVLTKQLETLTLLTNNWLRTQRLPPPPFIDAIAGEYALLSGFTLAVALVGLTISSLGTVSIRAAIRSISDVARIFRSQSTMFPFQRGQSAENQNRTEVVLETRDRKIDRKQRLVYKTPEGVLLPRMAGGSSQEIAKTGSLAAEYIPPVLALIWLGTLAWGALNRTDIVALYEDLAAVTLATAAQPNSIPIIPQASPLAGESSNLLLLDDDGDTLRE